MSAKPDEPGHPHSHAELCEAGSELYANALRSGRIPRSEADEVPCLLDLALLHPDPDDAQWLRPVPPSSALAQLLQPIEREILERRRLTVELSDAFEPFMAISAQNAPTTHAITVLEGLSRINATLDRVVAGCEKELLTVQPGGGRPAHGLSEALRRVRPLLGRGIRMRTLYQHTARHTELTLTYLEHVGPEVQVRTLEQIIDRLIIVDREVAFVPARSDRQVALELRHPGLVAYLAGVFDQFWQLAVPINEEIPYDLKSDGISGVQRSIAKLLVEGHVDEAIARRLGMNVRTCRAHIAKLASVLGSGSRAQLGYLIAQSGILEQDH
ncbi:helix-turn-helix transcriptional regulator [Streptomyces sp. CB03238]|uniref:helix-turn-helix transcriptional regulator n=1 Tax=Streptomyces sp. CB03238 TaxID=1907777 RepID=UPI000A10BC25|nr:helix-turn-helix transcriptional regulator [Streptomyces sp. CB03238]ORT59353.1 helix-turn-helix transcriptional regulator [Streptomyces sp. CB03238]